MGAIQFSSSHCGVVPFGTAEATGQGEESGGIIGGRKRKETPRQPRGFWDKRCVLSDYQSGETGIRTLGTRKGTPVFKTGLDSTQLPMECRVTPPYHSGGARIGAEFSGRRFWVRQSHLYY